MWGHEARSTPALDWDGGAPTAAPVLPSRGLAGWRRALPGRVMDGRIQVFLLTLLDSPRSGRDWCPNRFRYAHYPRACKSRTSHQVRLRFGGGSPDEATVG